MTSTDWLKELYSAGMIDLETYRSRLCELKGNLLESIKEIDALYDNPPEVTESAIKLGDSNV